MGNRKGRHAKAGANRRGKTDRLSPEDTAARAAAAAVAAEGERRGAAAVAAEGERRGALHTATRLAAARVVAAPAAESDPAPNPVTASSPTRVDPAPTPTAAAAAGVASSPTAGRLNPMPLSYADVVKKGVREHADYKSHQELANEFLEYLREASPFDTKELVSFTLKVKFEEMFEYDKKWAFSICNRGPELLLLLEKAATTFLATQKTVDNDAVIINQTKISFIGMPTSMKTLKDFIGGQALVTAVRLFVDEPDKVVVRIPTALGRLVFYNLLSAILDMHERNQTFAGKFDLDDIMVEDSNFKIRRKPLKAISGDRPKDLRQLKDLLFPFYKDENGGLPVYFKVLQKDLSRATESDANQKWFREYLLYHLALMPSRSRNNLTTGLHHVIKKFGRSAAERFWTDMLIAPPGCDDWTGHIRNSGWKVLESVFFFQYKNNSEPNDPYMYSTKSLLAYARHLIEHGDEYVKISDLDEIELFSASYFSFFLPWLVRTILEKCGMGKRFGPVWSNFKASRSDNWNATN